VETPATPTTPERTPRSPILFYAVVVLVVAAGIAHAASLATVNDDAFISFRYAQQLVNGHGLVYNPGERVEGYTNFLWTVLIAAGMSIGFDPVTWSIVLGICFFAGTLLVVCDLTRTMGGGDGAILPGVPLAAIALVLHRDMNVYATSGLETPMQAFLVTLLFALLARRTDVKAFFIAGLILTAALMTRPDAAVFVAAVALFILLGRKDLLRRSAALGAPLLLLFVPYWLIRWHYYGFFFPNAYYAKSIDLPYYSQGLTYTWMYFSSYYPLLLLVPLAIYSALRHRAKAEGSFPASDDSGQPGRPAGRRVLLLGMLLFLSFTLFVVRIGGDFMFARFFIPVTPVAFVLLELLIRRTSPAWAAYALAAFLLAGTFFRYDYFSGTNQVGYIADEWQRYPISSLAETKKSGAILRKYFDALPVQVAFWGGQARLMYYAEPYMAIETAAGLTDTFIAHESIAGRGRPGHEKSAPDDYLVRRGVNFYFRPFSPPPPGAPALNLIVFDSLVARIVVYDNAVMDSLRKFPGVYFRPMPEFLDAYIAGMEEKRREDVAADYAWLRVYYFRHNLDAAREKAFTDYLGRDPRPGG
jgi:hypothetical protein